jgi:PPOX class probable F420-dependent enzyme
MDAEAARRFVRDHPRAVMATLRKDGRPQLTPVLVGVDETGRLQISTREPSAKVQNLRRDPRVSLCMLQDRFFGGSVQIHGAAEIVSLPEAMELLVAYYRQAAGEHPNWDEYREAMRREQRCLVRITIEEAV